MRTTNEAHRRVLGLTVASTLLAILMASSSGAAEPARGNDGPIDIGNRLELFVDHFLIDKLDGVRLRLNHPTHDGVALRFEKPWEGAFCGYVTMIKDGDTYRMYYRGLPRAGKDGSSLEVYCYAESADGIHWTKPGLGLYEVNGTRENNVVLADAAPVTHNFAPFLDTRPDVAPDQRYKAIGGTRQSGLIPYVSPDGKRWRRLQDKPIITKGAFDSQNVAFWSQHENCYLCYFRTFKNGVRWITRTTSKDFLHWTEPVDMTFGDAPPEHLYTNQTRPYFRAPHIYIAVAARFMPGRRVLTKEQAKAIGVDPGYFGDCSESVLLTSRGGNEYDRTFMEAFIRPGLGLGNWVSRTNYPSYGIVPLDAKRMAIHVQKDYAQPSHRLVRYVLRTDGFASVHATYEGGEMRTKPLRFTGRELVLNASTSAAGSIRVEIQDAAGKPIDGYTLKDCDVVFGDDIERVVTWHGLSDVSSLIGKTVRLRFVLSDADLYSLRFRGSLAELEGPAPDVVYTFDDASGNVATDGMADDDRQNMTIGGQTMPGNLKLSTDRPIFGKQSLVVSGTVALPIPGTQNLGKQVTLAVHVRDVPAGHRRLFSSYNGASSKPQELIFDVDPDGSIAGNPGTEPHGIRFFYDGHQVGAPSKALRNWSKQAGDTKPHHIAATYDDGKVVIYFDGKQVGQGRAGKGPLISRLGDLRFNEDYPPTSLNNEPLIGTVDDIVILRRVLSAEQIATMASKGAAAVLCGEGAGGERAGDMLLTMEGDQPGLLRDMLRSKTAEDVHTMKGSVVASGQSSRHLWIGPSDGVHELTIPNTRILGRSFTLASTFELTSGGQGYRPLFWATRDSVTNKPGRLVMSIAPGLAKHDARVRLSCQAGIVEATGLPTLVGKRHHLAAVCDGGKVTLYLDGKQIAQGGKAMSRPLSPLVSDLHLGGGSGMGPKSGIDQAFIGRVDDVVVLGRALSADEVKTLSEKGASSIRAK